MSAKVTYGITSILPTSVKHKDRLRFLMEFSSMGLTKGYYEELKNFHDPGTLASTIQVKLENGVVKIVDYYPDNKRSFSEIWTRGNAQIMFDIWDQLNSIDIFVPNFLGKGPIVSYIDYLRRNKNIASLEYGMNIIMEKQWGAENREYWDPLSIIFKMAIENHLIVSII